MAREPGRQLDRQSDVVQIDGRQFVLTPVDGVLYSLGAAYLNLRSRVATLR